MRDALAAFRTSVGAPCATRSTGGHNPARASSASYRAHSIPSREDWPRTEKLTLADRARMLKIVTAPDLPPDGNWDNTAILIDKPLSFTSFDACALLRKLLGIRKVGHAGTLDPNATGLLIVCVGKATKAVDFFQGLGKAYEGTLRLGESTSSQDADTPVVESLPWEHITDDDLEAAAASFLGDQLQVPPMHSAIRIKGERLYHKARRGEVVERPPRSIHLDEFSVWRSAGEDANPQDVHFRVRCSKGTYVRTLCHDLGAKLGSAAHMTRLRRTAIGSHDVADAWDLNELRRVLG